MTNEAPLGTQPAQPEAAAAYNEVLAYAQESVSTPEVQEDQPSSEDQALQDATEGEPQVSAPPPAANEPSKAEQYLDRVVKAQQAAREQERKARAERKANRELIERGKKLGEYEKLAKEDPVALQKALDWDTEHWLKKQHELLEKDVPLNSDERLERLEKQLADERAEKVKEAEEAEDRRNNDASIAYRDNFVETVKELASTSGDRYEMISKFPGLANRVWNAFSRYYQDNGTLADPESVMDVIESKTRSDFQVFLSTNTAKSMMSEVSAKQPAQQLSLAPSKPGTLTNRNSRSTSPVIAKKRDDEEMTSEDRDELAIQLIEAAMKR